MEDSIGEEAGEKSATSAMSFSDQRRTRAEPMIGSSRGVLNSESGIVHPEQDVHYRDSSQLQEGSKLSDRLCIGAFGLTRSRASGFRESNELEDFEAEIEDCKCLDQVRGVSGARSSLFFGYRKRKVEGDEAGNRSPIWKDVRVKNLNSSSTMLAFQREDDEIQDGEDWDLEIFIKPIVRYPGEQHHRRERDEGSPSLMVAKAIDLPEELVEKILSMIPFPQILKTRVLNKSWYKNFSVSPDALVFQDQVNAVSAKWKHFCPIILNTEDEWLVGYDRECNRWQNMSFLNKHMVPRYKEKGDQQCCNKQVILHVL